MPNNLKIRVGVEGGKTDSRFTVQEGGAIALKNDANATLRVSFGNSSPLCLGTQRQLSVELVAGQAKSYKACAVPAEQSFRYTATVTNMQPEQAYIIVEKAAVITPEIATPDLKPIIVIHRELTGDNVFFGAAGILLGVLLSIFVESRWSARRNPPRP